MSALSEALDSYTRGAIAAADVVQLLPPKPDGPVVITPRTLDEVEDDRDPRGRLEAGTWDEIAAAHIAGRLSDEQYEELFEARHGTD